MKIAFYFPNASFSEIDCTQVEAGNPGIGGTEYTILSTVHALGKNFPEHQYILYANVSEHLPADISVFQANTVDDALIKAEKDGCRFFVVKFEPNYLLASVNFAKRHSIRLIMWAHNFIEEKYLKVLARESMVVSIVCVGRNQLNAYKDCLAHKKSCVIFNLFNISPLKKYINKISNLSERPLNITYVGNLVNYKGFHLLAKAWPLILKRYPEAHLHVIGSGRLYDRGISVGKYGLSTPEYETEFLESLTDNEGNLLPSVTFHGLMGVEKFTILAHSRVGVPNPSAISETFCITALEFQALGTPVVTLRANGFKDTVLRQQDLCNESTPEKLTEAICRCLELGEFDHQSALQFIEQNFSESVICQAWVDMLGNLEKGLSPQEHPKAKLCRGDWLETNRYLRINCRLFFIFPPAYIYRKICRKILHLFK